MKPTARHCAFCGQPKGCFAFVTTVLEALGGEKGNGYCHNACLSRAQRKIARRDRKRTDAGEVG